MRSKETETFGFYLSDEVKSGRMWGHFEAQIGLWKKASSKTASRKEAQLWYFTFSLVNFHFFCQHPVKNWHFLWTPSQNQLNVPIKCQKVIDIVKLVSSSVSSTHPTNLILMEVSKYILLFLVRNVREMFFDYHLRFAAKLPMSRQSPIIFFRLALNSDLELITPKS